MNHESMWHRHRRFLAVGERWLIVLGLALSPSLAKTQDEIVVGQTLPLTGTIAGVAQDLLRGREACVASINAGGGINGQLLRLVTKDDRGDPILAVRLDRDLVETQHAVALFGPVGPAVGAAVLEWAEEIGIAIIGPSGGDVQNRVHRWKSAYFLTANQSAEAARLTSHVTSLGWRRVAVVFADDALGHAGLTAFDEALSVAGINPVSVLHVDSSGKGAPDIAKALAGSSAEVVFLATSGQSTIAMLNALSQGRADMPPLQQVYGLSSSAGLSDLAALGRRARGFSMSEVLPYPREPRVPLVRTFNSALKSFPDSPPDRSYAELEGCLAPLVFAKALGNHRSDLSRASVLRVLQGAGVVNLGGFDIDLSSRTSPGSTFTDIVFIGDNGRIVR